MSTDVYGDRVRHLLKVFWNGNQSKMARDTKCSQATLSLIAAGSKKPGKRVLSLIADAYGVNGQWLFEGIGEPTSRIPGTLRPLDYTLPIFERPLPGAPGDYAKDFTGKRFQVMPIYARPENYLLELDGKERSLLLIDLKLKEGDLLVISTNRTYFPSKHELFQDLVVILDVKDSQKACLARAYFIPGVEDEVPDRIEADTFELDDLADLRRRGMVRKVKNKRYPGFDRVVDVNGKEKIVPMSESEFAEYFRVIDYREIVGVCRAMIRTRL